MKMHNFLLKVDIYSVPYVSNMHEWNGGKDSKFNKCVHLTLFVEEQHSKIWLRSGSLVHSTLKNVVCNKNLRIYCEILKC